MILLKTLLIEQDNQSKYNEPDSELNALFIGDRSSNEYARNIIKGGTVTGKIISKRNLDPDQLYKLLTRNLNDTYDIVSIMLGSIGADINLDYEETLNRLSVIFKTAKRFGANLIVIPGQPNQVKDVKQRSRLNDINKWIRSQNISNSIITTDNESPTEDINTVIQNKWIASINEPETNDRKKSPTTANKSSTELDSIDITSSVLEQSAALLRKFEAGGKIPLVPYWDVSNWRIGYGSSTVTTSSNKVIKLPSNKNKRPEDIIITVEDAERDLKRRLSTEFIPDTMKSIGNVKLPDNAIAALVSVAYNYGSLPSSVIQAIRETPTNIEKIADSVRSLKSNSKRRGQEADFILKTSNSNDSDDNTYANSNGGSGGDLENIKPVSYTGKFRITSKYGPRGGRMHRGLDISAVVGTTIYIKIPGVVIFAGDRDPNGWGNMVEIKHEDGNITRYAHLSRIDVSKNDVVTAGMLVGLTGGKRHAPGAGNSRAPHLHWEWVPKGSNVGKDGLSVVDDYLSFSKPTDIDDTETKDIISKTDTTNDMSLKSIVNTI